MTATTPDRSPVAELRPPVLPPIACTSWCVHQDGHPDLRHAEDQRCETEEHRTYLHLRMPESVEPGYNYVTAYAVRHGLTDLPSVFVGQGEDSGVFLTPAEARRLARGLRRMARLARVP